MLLITLYFLTSWSQQVGMDGDGPIRIEHGKANINYLLTLGKDTTFNDVVAYNSDIHYKHVKYYGTIIESTAIIISKIFKSENYYFINKTRRLLCAFFSIIAILYIGLFVKIGTNQWSWASLTILFAFISPTFIGYSFWQTKMAPVVAGFTISLFYTLLIFNNYPKISLKYFLGLTIGLAIALAVRIQGLLIIFYFIIIGLVYIVLFYKNLGSTKDIFKFITISGIFLLLGYTVGFITYPVFWEEGFFFIFKGLKVLQQHPQNPIGLFEGNLVRAHELPWYYLPKMLLITLPVFSGILFMTSIIAMIFHRKNKQDIFTYFILLFTFIFPIIYIIYSGTKIYGGWRHVIFIYPPFIILGVIGLSQFVKLNISKIYKHMFICAIIIFSTKTGIWVINNAPLQYFYYNESVGGVKGAFKNYILDDLQVSTEMGLQYLLKTEKIKYADNIVANTEIIHDLNLPNDSTSKATVGFINRNRATWRYGIFNPVFLSPAILEVGYPPKNTIKEIKVDGVPICCIVKRNDFNDVKGIQAYNKKEYEKAFNLLQKAYQYDNNNYIIYPYLAVLCYNFKQESNAKIFAQKQLRLFPNDKTANDILTRINKR